MCGVSQATDSGSFGYIPYGKLEEDVPKRGDREMRIPGFTAEESIYTTYGSYKQTLTGLLLWDETGVRPQQLFTAPLGPRFIIERNCRLECDPPIVFD